MLCYLELEVFASLTHQYFAVTMLSLVLSEAS